MSNPDSKPEFIGSPNILFDTLTWFQIGRPEPDRKDFHSQLGCHFEEVREMIQELNTDDTTTLELINNAEEAIHALANHLKANDDVVTVDNPKGYLDAICDQIVTVTGLAHISEFKILGAMKEVNRSNYSKFVDGKPIYDENKKIIKGPNYSPADLTPYI